MFLMFDFYMGFWDRNVYFFVYEVSIFLSRLLIILVLYLYVD